MAILLLVGLSLPEPGQLDRAREALQFRRAEEAVRLVTSFLASTALPSEAIPTPLVSRDDIRQAHFVRGAAYQMLGATVKAAEDFGRALELEPDDSETRLSLGRIRLRQARLREARDDLAPVVVADEGNAEAHHLLGVVHLDLSREPGALREKELALARRALERALELNLLHPPTVSLLTVVLDELGLFADSERVFQSALDGLEREPARLEELALIYMRLKNHARAARALELLPKEGSDLGRRLLQLGLCYKETGRHTEAKGHLRESVRLDPENAAAWYVLGSVLLQQGEVDPARAALERALHDGEVGARAHVELARLLGSQEDHPFDKAFEHCQEAIAREPELAEAHYQLGQLLAQAGRVDEASRAFERFDALKKLSEEIQRYSDRVSHFTDEVASYLELARLYRQQGRADKAAVALQRAGRIDPDLIAIPLAMAELLIEQGHYEEALSYSRQVIDREPRNPDALWQVSSIHLARNDPIESERSLRLLLDVDPGHARGWNDLGVLLERAAHYKEAIAAFERAISLDAEFALPENGLGVVFFAMGDYRQALSHFERVVDLAPSYAQARLNLAEVYRRLGREAEAEAQMREYERLR